MLYLFTEMIISVIKKITFAVAFIYCLSLTYLIHKVLPYTLVVYYKPLYIYMCVFLYLKLFRCISTLNNINKCRRMDFHFESKIWLRSVSISYHDGRVEVNLWQARHLERNLKSPLSWNNGGRAD